MGPMITKEMKYNLHYGEVQGDVLPPLQCSKVNVKKIVFGNKEHNTD